MTIPLWVLLIFAVWTLAFLLTTVGIYRWSHILTGRAQLVDYPADNPEGRPVYLRAMRAHANCLENLPVYGAIVLVASAAQIDLVSLDRLAIVLLIGRVAQSIIHIAFEQTNRVIAFRFAFYMAQVIAMLWMAGIIAFAAM